ncbi:MAG: electron transporter RnfD [Oscillospiraceae bacterium]|nr:electron transporter RnfD [Oscillospiraceae bacterium]
MLYEMNNPYIDYMGRIDTSDPKAPVFYYAGSQLEIRFRGTALSIKIKNHSNWGIVSLGYIIDGRMGRLPLKYENNYNEVTVQLCANLESDKEHELIIYKRISSNHSYSLSGIDIENGELLPVNRSYSLNMEVYGDSVCAGEVCEAAGFEGLCDPVGHESIYDNSWYSFVMQTSRNLNARIHNIAQGGIAVFDDTGYFHWPKMIGMESVYDKLCYFPEAGELTSWDFSRYTPDVVVFALGQNDKHNGITDADDLDITDPDYRRKWMDGYMGIIRSLSEKYGDKVKFVLTTTVLNHDKAWDDTIEAIKDELNAEGIKAYHNLFRRNGSATHGHPRIAEHNEMAEELTAFIKGIL